MAAVSTAHIAARRSRSPALADEGHAPVHIQQHPRRILPLLDPPARELAAMRYQTALRYPGAKSGLARHLSVLLKQASAVIGRPALLVEPFAGGASASLRLVGDGVVDRVLLADADPLVARFWQVAAADTQWLIDRMWDEPVTLERWDYWRAYVPKNAADRESAVKCLFLNRTTFSGILHGRAGPIGGRVQTGNYKIDCRFTKASLEQRLLYVGDLYRSNRIVDVWCKDWEDTLADIAEWYPALLPNRVVAYLDPPYLEKSAKLYGLSFSPAGGYAPSRRGIDMPGWREGLQHYRLADYLRRRMRFRWILSYDNHTDLIEDPFLYAAARMTPEASDRRMLGIKTWHISKRTVALRYTVSGSGMQQPTTELLLTTLPPSCVPEDETFLAVRGS